MDADDDVIARITYDRRGVVDTIEITVSPDQEIFCQLIDMAAAPWATGEEGFLITLSTTFFNAMMADENLEGLVIGLFEVMTKPLLDERRRLREAVDHIKHLESGGRDQATQPDPQGGEGHTAPRPD